MDRKTMGVILLIIGALMMVYTGFTYVTKEKVVDIGPIDISKEESHPVQWSPIVGVILCLGGIALIATNKKSA